MRPLLWLVVLSLLFLLAWQVLGPNTPEGEVEGGASITEEPQQELAQVPPPPVVEVAPITRSEEPAPAPAAEEASSQVVTLSVRVDEIVSLFENASWVHRGLDGPVLYVVGFRTCTSCLAFKQAELEGLEDAGVDVRWIIYTRRDREGRQRSSTEERAVQAELWLSRDWDLFQDWYAIDPDTFYVTSQLPPVAEEDPARTAAVEEARALVEALSDLYGENGVDLYIPSLLWQQDGQWKTYVGYEEASFAPVRAALTGQ